MEILKTINKEVFLNTFYKNNKKKVNIISLTSEENVIWKK